MSAPRRLFRDVLVRGTEDHYTDPELYDFEYRDRFTDIDWYCDLADERAKGGRVLELGAGTGRISIAMALRGHHVTAFDRFEPMLERLRAKLAEHAASLAVATVQGEMTHLPMPESSFDLVISPFNALNHLYTWQDLLQCFQEARRVLVPGGTFAFDVTLPDLRWLTWDPKARHAATPFEHPTTGERLVYSTNHSYDPETQICDIRIYYDDAPPPGRRFKPPRTPRRLVHLAHRQIFPEEIRALTCLAGFSLESLSGDFCGLSLHDGIESQVALCRRPTSDEPG